VNLWQIRHFRDNMQRLAILPILAIAAAWGGMHLARQVVAWQTEAVAQPQDTAEQADEQPVAVDEAAAPTNSEPGEAPETEKEPATEPEPDPEIVAAAEKLLESARDMLYDYKSVRAKLTERASFGTRRFTAEGEYIAGVFPQMWMEYHVTVGGSQGRMLEVCDGQILFSEKEIRPAGSEGSTAQDVQIQVTRKDVRQILQSTGTGTDASPEAVVQAELSLGGLPTLLASLQRTMVFDAIKEDVYQDKPYTILQGRWKKEYLEQLGKQMGQAAQSLATFMPDRVRVYLDGATQFPTRILYLKQVTVEPVKYEPIMALEFTDVVLNEDVDPQKFRYVPPSGVNVVDETGVYLKMIEEMRAALQQPAPVDPAQPQDATEPEAAE
jgi:hypothetical protein